ncbi:MAG: transglycosylase domain-containing protein [Hyphomicrobium sp.]|nr:transglycosylase domain-containing protein [Hyphomicrobium sp.]
MIAIYRLLTRLLEIAAGVPIKVLRFVADRIVFNPRLGPIRHVLTLTLSYVLFAILLVYVMAPIRGIWGGLALSDKLHYDAERWLATAIYDSRDGFIGTFDPRLDSVRDVNYSSKPIEIGDYSANPDHKSIPVREVPEHYWKCLVFHEDRHLGTWLNPYGIDLLGVLKIPLSSIERSIALRRPVIGVGGSTLPMQFVRVIYKTPPDAREDGITKLRRKLNEWWMAPVIWHELTKEGDLTPLKSWAANHIWLAQRTGGAPLHGVEVTSRIVFGKEAKDLSIAEQMVLASAVNKPIILMPGNERLNEVRLDRWRYITEVRARACAEKLLENDEEKKSALFELVALAGGPPDPKIRPRLQTALETYAPALAARAGANPVIRANALMPSARFGLREEMKQTFGFEWRSYVRSVTTTFDAIENLAFDQKMRAALTTLDGKLRDRIGHGYSLDPSRAGPETRVPNVAVAAADHAGKIVRYFETGETAAYFGAPAARDPESGFYAPDRDPRMIASTGKIIAAIAIANAGRDTPDSLYLDTAAPEAGLETCRRGGTGRHGRRAIVAFACSLNEPLLNRTALAGQDTVQRLIDRLGFTMPPRDANGERVPPSTAAVLGQISGSPRRVHHMAGVALAAMLGRGDVPLKLPTLVKAYEYTRPEAAAAASGPIATGTMPQSVVRQGATPLLKTLLQAPLCYAVGKNPTGTLKSLSGWCAARRPGLRFHFAKTGTQVTSDPNATVDVWATGGLQFANGAAYSYVVLVGTGTGGEPWATSLHAAQVAAPLLEVLLTDLESHAKSNPAAHLLPKPKPPAAEPVASAEKAPSADLSNAELTRRALLP